jgi:outer membrane biosynthesis protein TonB
MNNQARIAAAVASGYLLGRTRKMKLAITVGGLLMGHRIPTSPKGLLEEGQKLAEQNPELAKIQDQIRDKLFEAAKGAALATLVSQLNSVSDTLRDRTEGLRGALELEQSEDEAPEDEAPEDEAPSDEEEEAEQPTDESEEEPEEGEEEPEEKPRPRTRTSSRRGPAKKTAKAAAKKAPAKKAPAKKSAAKKAPAKKAPAKKTTAKKTAAKKSTRSRSTRSGR